MKKKILSIILIIVVFQYFCTFVFAENSETNEIVTNAINNSTTNELSLNEQKEEIDNKIAETSDQLEYVQDELTASLLKVQETEDKISQYEKEIEELGQKMETLQNSINDASAKLAVATQYYQEKSDLLARRLVAIYESGDTQYLDVLLKAKSITEFISRSYMIQEIAEYDSKLIDQIEQVKDEMDITKQKLENEQNEIRIIKSRSEQTSIVLPESRSAKVSPIQITVFKPAW